jgi:hypothetical protein
MIKQLLPLVAAASVVCADEYNHRYKEGDRVDLWVNKVSPEPILYSRLGVPSGQRRICGERRRGGGVDGCFIGAEDGGEGHRNSCHRFSMLT